MFRRRNGVNGSGGQPQLMRKKKYFLVEARRKLSLTKRSPPPWPGPVTAIGSCRIHEGESLMSQSRLLGSSDNGGGTYQVFKLPTSGLRSAGARRSMLGFRTCRRRLGYGSGQEEQPGQQGGDR